MSPRLGLSWWELMAAGQDPLLAVKALQPLQGQGLSLRSLVSSTEKGLLSFLFKDLVVSQLYLS